MDSLDLHYAKSVLLRTLEKGGPATKSDYKGIASNWRSLSDVVEALARDGYLTVSQEVLGRKTFQIALTPKGLTAAMQLQRIEKPESLGFLTEEQNILIHLLDKGDSEFNSLKKKFPNAFNAISGLKEMKLVDTRIDKTKHPQESIVFLSEKGKKVAKHLKEIKEILGGE